MSGEIVGIFERRSVNIFYVKVSRYVGSVLNSVDLVSSRVSRVPCHHAIVLWWVQNFFSWVFRGFEIFSRGYFVGPTVFLVGTSWVQHIF